MTTEAAAAVKYPAIGKIRRLSPELDRIIAPDAVIEQLADGITWAEGPVWLWEERCLLFSDVPGNTMYRWSEKDGKTVFLKPSGYDGPPSKAFREPGVNGMTLDLAGEVVVCDHGNRAVSRLDRATRKKTVIVDRDSTLAASPSVDITNDVLAQLNQQLPSVSVTPLPRRQA